MCTVARQVWAQSNFMFPRDGFHESSVFVNFNYFMRSLDNVNIPNKIGLVNSDISKRSNSGRFSSHNDEVSMNSFPASRSDLSRRSTPEPASTAPEIPESAFAQTRYAVSDEEESDDDASLITTEEESSTIIRSSTSIQEDEGESSIAPSPKPKAAKARSTPVKKAPARASSRAKGKAKQTEGSKSKKRLWTGLLFSSRGIWMNELLILSLKLMGISGYHHQGRFSIHSSRLRSYVKSQIVDFYAALPQPGPIVFE
ncbi:unnamed protein product [Microthlaspi erraticum]|uniref:Uncharacterized protein n=1 Tax=Microthlaspi erraticum TaxID=1685480 RepID=A0A6D2I5U1_9BRAS|nr:unnamed protein product [Microthlaspi erraticum]